MITRMWEARLDHDCPPDGDSLPEECEVYVSYDGPKRVVVISHWNDEAELSAYAGSEWHLDPSAETGAFGDAVSGAAHVWHFTRI